MGSAGLSGLACEGEHGKRLDIRGLELEGQAVHEVQPVDRRRGALRVRQGVRDRDAHVRVPEVGERGAVAEAHDRVDDRGRVDDDLDLLVREPEQEVRLDQLEPLVRERGRIDRDLRPHAPRRVRKRVGAGHVRELLARSAAKRAARGREDDRVDGIEVAPLQALEDR